MRYCLVFMFCLFCLQANANWDNPADRYANAHKPHLSASCPIVNSPIKHFVYFARDRQAIKNHPLLFNANFAGAQIMYPWRLLESEKGQYDFSIIQSDLDYLAKHNKKLFIQLQDATFTPSFKAIPDYLLGTEYGGGAVPQYTDTGEIEGWAAKRWHPAVQARFAKLLKAMGEALDKQVEGINLQETAISVDAKGDTDFVESEYPAAIKTNMLALKTGFPTATKVQYANFMHGEWLPWEDKGYLKSIYEYGEQIGVGLGGPDLMFRRRGQLNHTLAMMHENIYTVPLAIAVQDGNYIGETGNYAADKDSRDRTNIVPALHSFAKDFLKVDYMFWVNQTPYFEQDVLPCFQP